MGVPGMAELAAAAVLAAAPRPAAAQDRPRIAVFDFSLVNTSPAASTPKELARLHRLDSQLRDELGHRYTLVDTAAAQAEQERVDGIRGCNGCELPAARALGVQVAAYGWGGRSAT